MAKKFISLKKEIDGIKDIRETIKTLEKISATDIHRLKTVSENMENYELALEDIFENSGQEFSEHPFFNKFLGEKKRLGVVLSTEKGLCGGLLNNLVDFVRLNLRKGDEVLVIGGKGKKLLEERGIGVKLFFKGWDEIPKKEDIKRIEDLLISKFLEKEYEEILVFYPSFESLGIQRPKIFVFLPLNFKEFRENIQKKIEVTGDPIYEPDKNKFRDYLIKEYISLSFYQKILETKLSELSARTVAMEESGEKAKQLLLSLSHQYFRIKRETITKELNDLYSSHRR